MSQTLAKKKGFIAFEMSHKIPFKNHRFKKAKNFVSRFCFFSQFFSERINHLPDSDDYIFIFRSSSRICEWSKKRIDHRKKICEKKPKTRFQRMFASRKLVQCASKRLHPLGRLMYKAPRLKFTQPLSGLESLEQRKRTTNQGDLDLKSQQRRAKVKNFDLFPLFGASEKY